MGFDINSKHSAKATTTVQRLVRDGFIALALTLTVVTPSVGQTADELRAMAQAQLGALEPVTEREVASPAVDLGRKLFWDSRLSSDGNTACASCHYQQAWGSDSRQRSMTARGEPTGMHSMTVFNTQVAAAGLRWFGDRPSGAAQAIGSITGSMGFESREDILPVMAEHGYEEGFQQAFPDDSDYFSVDNYGEALEAYQRAL
ncbi:MAG: cytochrome-c peroxidase, partial [Pseudohongiella sp.]